MSETLYGPVVAENATRSTPKPAPPPEIKVPIKSIEVSGSTLLTPQEISSITSGYIGKEIQLDTLKDVAVQITGLYRKKGYLLARAFVPPQDIQNGVVEIDVVEGKIGKIDVEGNKHYSSDFIRYYFSPAARRGVSEDFERALVLLNEFPDLHVRAFLKPGGKQGTTDVLLKVEDSEPSHGQLDYNNFGNPLVGRNRFGFEYWHGSLSGRGDLLDARMVVPVPTNNESPFYQAYYTTPISPSGAKLTGSFASADIRVGQDLQVLDIRGTAQIYGFTFTQPLSRTTTGGSDFTASFYAKNVSNFFLTSFLTSRDRLRELALGFDRQWATDTARDFLTSSVTQGLGTFMGGMMRGDPLASRVGADDSFTKANVELVHIQRVFTNKYLLLHGTAQYSLSPLAITEQFALGGPDSVRGYEQSEFLGDSGWTASAEFRVPMTANTDVNSLQTAFFVDTGYMTLRNALPGSVSKKQLTGGGVGLRAGLGKSTSLRIDLGFPISPSKNLSNELPVLYAQFSKQF